MKRLVVVMALAGTLAFQGACAGESEGTDAGTAADAAQASADVGQAGADAAQVGADAATSPDAGGGSPDAGGTGISYSKDIQPIWTASCAFCHLNGKTQGNLALDANVSYANLVDKAAGCDATRKLVVKNDLTKSELYLKLMGDMSRCLQPMPPANALNATKPADVAKVRQWIEAGAPNN